MDSIRRLAIWGVLAVVFGLGGLSCGREVSRETETKAQPPAPMVEKVAKVALKTKLDAANYVDAVKMWESADQIKNDCAAHIENAAALQARIKNYKGEADGEHPLISYNKLLIQLDRVRHMADLILNVHPQKEVREASEKCQQDVEGYISKLNLDRGVFDVLQKVDVATLDDGAARFHKHTLRDYRRAGVDKDEATRGKLASLKESMVKTGQEFRRNIREDRRVIQVTPKQLEGMPEDFIKAHKPGKDGKIELSTDYPDLKPILNYAADEQVREDLWRQSRNRAYPVNEGKLRALLETRHDYATSLGYAHWGDYETETKMIKTGKAIDEFLNKIADIARKPMLEERDALLERKTKDNPAADALRAWDGYYYINKIREERFKAEPQELRKYLAFAKVKEGMLNLAQELFDIKFKKVDAPVWHESVEAYEMYLDGKKAGNFYLDLHPREDKYGHAAMFQIYHGVDGAQLPAATLVCNFPEPKDGDPALMEHQQVKTMFHEFGHLMHHLLAGRLDWVTFSGVQAEWDFVEVPSQVLEEWVWDVRVMQAFAKHFETGAEIPAELLEKMHAAEEFGKGVYVMRQLWLAGMSYTFHVTDVTKLDDLNQVSKDMAQKYSPYPFEPEAHFYASFSHLDGYSVAYYTYMWSLMLAKDILGRFNKEGMLNKTTAMEYRRAILERGGSKDAAQLVSDFLGRDYSFDAFAAWLSS